MEKKLTNLDKLKAKCDSRVYAYFIKKAGKFAEQNAKEILELYKTNHCMLERALADVVEKYDRRSRR